MRLMICIVVEAFHTKIYKICHNNTCTHWHKRTLPKLYHNRDFSFSSVKNLSHLFIFTLTTRLVKCRAYWIYIIKKFWNKRTYMRYLWDYNQATFSIFNSWSSLSQFLQFKLLHFILVFGSMLMQIFRVISHF